MLVWTGFYSGYILNNKKTDAVYFNWFKVQVEIKTSSKPWNLPKFSVFFAFDILLLDGFILVYKSTTDNKAEQVLVL